MSRKIGILFLVIGILFILNAIFGRYIVLPGYLQSLESGISSSSIPENVPILKVLRYLLWAFSFKFGIYFIVLGFLFINKRKAFDKAVFAIIGVIYISIAYMDLPFNYSIFFGIGGGIITIAASIIMWKLNKYYEKEDTKNVIQDLGYFFLVMAAYNLCPFFGVKCYALDPEKMIKYGLQSTAVSFANHIMIELVLGFVLLAIYQIVMKTKRKNA